MDRELDIQHGVGDVSPTFQQVANISLRTFSNPIQPLTISNEYSETRQNSALESSVDSNESENFKQVEKLEKETLNLNGGLNLEKKLQTQEKLRVQLQVKSHENKDSINKVAINKDSEIIQATKSKTKPTKQTQINVIANANFFQKTQKLLQHLADLSIFDSETLQKGMKIDLSQEDSDFFILYIGSELHLACAYTYVLDERAFVKKDSPDLHFMRCDFIRKTSQDLLKVCVPKKNSFDYRVRSNGVDTRLFYEHPLRVCHMCIAGLCDVLSKKHKRKINVNQIKEDEVMMLLFKNKLKNLVM